MCACVWHFIAWTSIHALSCIWGNKVFELELVALLQPARLFHAPTRTTSSGCLMLHNIISEAIRDVEQTTAPSAKRSHQLRRTRHRTHRKLRCLINVVKFSTTKKIAPVNHTRLLLKVATVYLSQWRRWVKIFCTELVTVDTVDVKQSLARFSRKWRFLKNGHRNLHVLP